MRSGEKGFTLSELLLVFVIVLVCGALLLPLIRYSQVRMDRIACANNLREVGLALYIYAREHDSRFPDTLKELYGSQYLADAGLMDCPATRAVGTPEDPDYIYTPGLTVRDASMVALVRDEPGNHGGKGGNVLYVNGEVAWIEGN